MIFLDKKRENTYNIKTMTNAIFSSIEKKTKDCKLGI